MRWLLERRLSDVSSRIKRAQEELRVADEQYGYLGAEAEDARIRAMVAETPLAAHEHRQAQGPAEALARERSRLQEQIADLRRRQDELLDRLSAASEGR